MERRVALVRALNVGGTGLLRMERLQAVSEELGWRDVSTLGASGNVLYTAGRTKAETDGRRLAVALAKELGKPAAVIVRTQADLQTVVDADPFAQADARIPPKWWFTGLLAKASNGVLPEIPTGAPLAYAGRLPREVCWTMSTPDRRAIDLPKRIERALDVPMTVRNWNVVREISARLA